MSTNRVRRKYVPRRPSQGLPPHLTTKEGTRLHVYSLRDPYRLTPVASYDKTQGGWVRIGDRHEKHSCIQDAVAYAADHHDERMEPCRDTRSGAADRLWPLRPLPSAGPTAEL